MKKMVQMNEYRFNSMNNKTDSSDKIGGIFVDELFMGTVVVIKNSQVKHDLLFPQDLFLNPFHHIHYFQTLGTHLRHLFQLNICDITSLSSCC